MLLLCSRIIAQYILLGLCISYYTFFVVVGAFQWKSEEINGVKTLTSSGISARTP